MPTIANTILQQLGARRFIAMTGAKNLIDHGNALSLRFPKPRDRKLNYLKVSYEPFDTYTLQFGYIRGLKFKPAEPITGVYCDDLQRIFTAQTGLDTSL